MLYKAKFTVGFSTPTKQNIKWTGITHSRNTAPSVGPQMKYMKEVQNWETQAKQIIIDIGKMVSPNAVFGVVDYESPMLGYVKIVKNTKTKKNKIGVLLCHSQIELRLS